MILAGWADSSRRTNCFPRPSHAASIAVRSIHRLRGEGSAVSSARRKASLPSLQTSHRGLVLSSRVATTRDERRWEIATPAVMTINRSKEGQQMSMPMVTDTCRAGVHISHQNLGASQDRESGVRS